MERLFPNLPDEVGIQCLLRVPYKSHENLRKVCKNWEAVVNSREFYQQRKRLKICEEYLFLVTEINHPIVPNGFELSVYEYDPVNNKWTTRLSSIPGKVGLPVPIAVNQKLISIGRLRVIVYDILSGKWNSQVVELPKHRYLCVCSASPEGLIYIAGGDLVRTAQGFDCGAAVYNVEQKKWEALPDMNRPMHYSQGAFADGKFYVSNVSEMQVEMFDTNAQVWTALEWTDAWFSQCNFVSAFGKLYSFKTEGVMKYD